MFFPSLLVASQSAVVTTTGNGNASLDMVPGELLNISCTSNISNISHILPPELQGEIQDESDDFKDLVNEELKNLKLAEEMEKHKEQEKMRQVAAEKAKLLWRKTKEKGKADAEAECKKRELLRIQAEQQHLKELAIANERKKHKEKLKQELKNEIQLKCMKEKEILEMNEIKEKFAEELEMQVRKEMGLHTTPLSQLPRPMLDVHRHDSPTRVTPSSEYQEGEVGNSRLN